MKHDDSIISPRELSNELRGRPSISSTQPHPGRRLHLAGLGVGHSQKGFLQSLKNSYHARATSRCNLETMPSQTRHEARQIMHMQVPGLGCHLISDAEVKAQTVSKNSRYIHRSVCPGSSDCTCRLRDSQWQPACSFQTSETGDNQ